MLEHSMVSCIMPTYDRRKFVPQAIKYFLRQDYQNTELIVLDAKPADKIGAAITGTRFRREL